MGDFVDRANERVEEFLAVSLERHRLAAQEVESNTSGDCVDCGDPIPPERLALLPNTPRCIECQGFKDKEDRRNR